MQVMETKAGKVSVYYTGSLEDERTERIASIKQACSTRILDKFATWKQANMTARGVELTLISTQRDWTQGETDEAKKLQEDWAWIKLQREQSDVAEAEVTLAKTCEEVWAVEY